MKPNVVFFSHYYPPGTDAASITIAKLLKPLGERAEVMVYVPAGHAGAPLSGIRYHFAPKLPAIFAFSLAHFLNALTVWRQRNACRPDIIIVEYIPHTFAATAGLLVGRILRRPVIVKAHDIIPVFPANPLKALSVLISSRLNYWLLRWAALVFVVSPELAERVKRETGLPADRVRLYPNGADVPTVQPSLPEDNHVLFVGGLYPEDGTDLLLQAWPAVLEKIPSAQLTLIGDGPERSRFEEIVNKNGTANSVTFRGYIPHAEVAKAIRSARVCIGTLRQTEQLASAVPNKTVEYFAQGRPVVSSPISQIFPRDAFWLVENNQEIGVRLIELLSEKKIAIILGTKAWQTAANQFDWQAIFATFYEGIVHVMEGNNQN